jgi:cell division protein FtsW
MIARQTDESIANQIAMVVILLMAIGTVFVFSASATILQEFDLRRFYSFLSFRQLLFFPLAVIVMYIFSAFNYRWFSVEKGWFESPTAYMLALSVGLLVLVLIPRFGTEINFARRWLRIPAGPISISFQPSELAKWTVIFFLAAFGDRYASTMDSYRKRFIPACMVIVAVVGLIITQDLGTAAFISLLSFIILIISGARFWHVLTLMPAGILGFLFILVHSPGRMQRLAAFIEPEKWAGSSAYQASQSLIALGSGGLLGKGLGMGISKYGHLPEDTTDFVFAIIGEELGLVGTIAVILLFIMFIWLGVLVVIRCKDRFGQILAAGIVLAIGIQAALNIGVVTVVLPTKGIPLPFVSAGGTSMLLAAAAVGVLLNIAQHPSPDEPPQVLETQ